MRRPLPDGTGGGLFALRLRARSPDQQVLQLGLRQRGGDYAFLWSATTSIGPGWQDRVWRFQVPTIDQPINLSLHAVSRTPDPLDIGQVRLGRIDAAELARLMRLTEPHP